MNAPANLSADAARATMIDVLDRQKAAHIRDGAPSAELRIDRINRCVPDAELMTTATGFAKELAAGPKALGMIRKLMWDSLDNDWVAQLHEERMGQKVAGKTADFIEGVTAFLQKRKAEFKGT